MLADLRKLTLRSACHVALAGLLVLSAPGSGIAASWATVTALPRSSSVGTMLLLTDGTVMMENGGGPGWLRLTPDANGNYATGSWTTNPIADMSKARLYFASQILPNGKVWVLGGEYSGPGTPRTDTPTSEIYDPVANTWSPAARYPDQPGKCGTNTISYPGDTTSGSNLITGIPSTNDFYVGWSVTRSEEHTSELQSLRHLVC